MDRPHGLHPHTVTISDDEQGSTSKTGSQSRRNGRANKRSYSSSADHSSGYRQAGEEQGSPSKIPRTSPYQQSSLGQTIPPQTLRPLFDNPPGNDEGFQILYSGELRKRQRSASVISIDDDEVDDGDDDGNPNRSDLLFMFDHVNRDASNPTFPAGITVKDFMSDEDFNRYMANEQEPKRYQQSLNLKSRLPSMTIRPARIAIYKHDYHGLQLSNGVSVELQNGDFIKIAELQKDTFSMTIYLRGRLFRRMRFMGGTIEKKMNEICLMQKINQADVRNHKEQALEEVDVQYVARRRSLRMTNRPFPELSFREEDYISPKSVIMNERVLVCRWRYICSFPNERALQKNAHCEKALIALRPDEADEADAKWSQDNEALRRNFRGYTIKGGASSTVRPVESPLIQEEQDSTKKASNRSKGLLPMTSTANSSFNSPGSPGSSFDTPFNVDLHLSRMSLKPVDFWLNGPGTVSKTTDKAHEANPRVSLPRQKATGVLPNSSNGAVIDLTFDERHYSRHEELRQESRGDHRQNDNGSKERKANTGRSNAQSQPRASTTANLWDVRNGVFVEKNVRWSTSPKLGSPSDSDSTVTGDDNTAAADHEEVQEVPRQHFYDGHIGNHTELLMRGQSGSFGRRNTVDTLRTGRNLQRYTFGDGFSGCGGVSRGATMAGLKLQWAFDFQRAMCKSYCRNFRASRVYCIDAFDFATRLNIDAQVDILHLSPPCQFFSPAHTTQGINDDSNTASSFVIGELLKKAKPRIVTLENTLGLEQRHPLYLHAVIQQFTVLGFSIRWKTIDLRDYGVPQSRRRLIIIAACPGEILPDFPAPTHSKSPETTGLKPWATINESINTIPRGWLDHDVSKANQTQRQPFDGNTQAKCMTTGGGSDNYHPTGDRGYTIREYACLQTFPLEHEWDPEATVTQRRQQIGNAVPPLFYAALARKIVQTLRKTDGLVEVKDLTADPQPPRSERQQRQSFESSRPGNIQRATGYRFQ